MKFRLILSHLIKFYITLCYITNLLVIMVSLLVVFITPIGNEIIPRKEKNYILENQITR